MVSILSNWSVRRKLWKSNNNTSTFQSLTGTKLFLWSGISSWGRVWFFLCGEFYCFWCLWTLRTILIVFVVIEASTNPVRIVVSKIFISLSLHLVTKRFKNRFCHVLFVLRVVVKLFFLHLIWNAFIEYCPFHHIFHISTSKAHEKIPMPPFVLFCHFKIWTFPLFWWIFLSTGNTGFHRCLPVILPFLFGL